MVLNRAPFVIGIAGGTGSGKTTVVTALIEAVGEQRVVRLEQDSYYRHRAELTPAARAALNYDHPDALDLDLLAHHLRELRSGRPVETPTYDFRTHLRKATGRRLEPRACVVVEGILVLGSAELRAQMDLRLYVETDADIRFIRRLRRDTIERGRTVESVIEQWERAVRPMHLEYVEPSRRHAHLIVPESGGPEALEVLLSRVRAVLGLKAG